MRGSDELGRFEEDEAFHLHIFAVHRVRLGLAEVEEATKGLG